MVRIGKITAAVCAAVMMAGAAGLPCIGGLADGSAIKASAASLNAIGICGTAAVWEYTSDGVLTIKGTGSMYDFSPYTGGKENLMREFRSSVKTIIIEDGITTIGAYAFQKFENVTSVRLPKTLLYIHDAAFVACTSLKKVEIPYGTRRIDDLAFATCPSLESVTIPSTLEAVHDYAFGSCTSLRYITLPPTLRVIGTRAFGYDFPIGYSSGLGSPIEGFQIMCAPGSCGEAYAKDSNFATRPFIYGDTNCDGSLNNEDLAQLQKYVAGWNVWMEPSVADVAVDGRINGEDIALLQKYLAGWEVQLGKKGGTS